MTAQAMERLLYEGEGQALATLPLEAYFQKTGAPRPQGGGMRSTGLSRGYIGSWEVRDGRLYLVGLQIGVLARADGEAQKDGLRTVFPDKDEVLADWFTGTLRCPQGERLAYVHGGFGSTYEKDLLIEVKDGTIAVRSIWKLCFSRFNIIF